MSFNRSGYIGRAPGDSAITIAKQYFQPSAIGKTFTFSSGYDPGLVDVYRNGIKLINVLDYAATDGSTIVLDTPVGVGSTVQVVAYKAYNVATVKATELDTTVTGTTINLGGDITAANATISVLTTTVDLNVSAAATVSGTLAVGTGVTVYGNVGIVSATTFYGSGANLTSLPAGTTITVADESSDTTCFPSFFTAATGDLAPKTGSNLTFNSSSGALTATSVAGNIVGGTVSGTTGTFSGAVNVDDTTDSTSSATGALIVDGGLGVAKNVYIGAGLSVAGTLTYEDVTNVDSVGLITAKSGVNVSGGQVTIGTGITMGIAGVATFSGTSDVHLLDNVKLLSGDGSDLQLYHNGSASIINNSTGNLSVQSSGNIWIENQAGSKVYIKALADAATEIYYNNSKKFETTNDGTVTTGIGTFTAGLSINADSKNLEIGAGNDLQLYHNGTDSYIDNITGNLILRVNTNEKSIVGVSNGAVELYNDNIKSFATTNNGIIVNGTEGASSFLYMYADEGDDNADKWRIVNDVSDSALYFQNYTSGSYTSTLKLNANGSADLYHTNSKKFETTNEGAKITGFTSTTAGMGVTGGLFEGAFIKAGKLSDNKTLGISTANVFYFTTAETTTGTPDIRWNDSYTLSSKMAVGDVASVTVITTAAAAGYSANWTIDGNAVTEEWVGGSAPSAGGSDGLDIYSFTIIKTGTGTGDSGWKVIGNLSNAT